MLLGHRSLTHWLIKGHNLEGCVILRSQNCVSSRQESRAQIDNKGASVLVHLVLQRKVYANREKNKPNRFDLEYALAPQKSKLDNWSCWNNYIIINQPTGKKCFYINIECFLL